MIPIKAKTLIKEVSLKTGISEAVVEKVIDYYYSKVKEGLTNLDFTAFILEGFGKFRIRERMLLKNERSLNETIKRLSEKETPFSETRIRNAKEDLVKFDKVKRICAETHQKKEFITLHKITYKDDKVREALEGQVEDSHGTHKPLPTEEGNKKNG